MKPAFEHTAAAEQNAIATARRHLQADRNQQLIAKVFSKADEAEEGLTPRAYRERNAAVRRARGDLVFVWDDDDYFSPSRLRTQAAALGRGGHHGAVLLGADEPGMAFYFDAEEEGGGAFREVSGSSFAQPCSMAFTIRLNCASCSSQWCRGQGRDPRACRRC